MDPVSWFRADQLKFLQGVDQSVKKRQNGFAYASHPVRTIVGAITNLTDIRIGLFSKESIAGPIISFVGSRLICWVVMNRFAFK
jgi:hypothetical protein